MEALGEVWLSEGMADVGSGVHPALLDACFQVVGAAHHSTGAETGTKIPTNVVWLPVGWDRFWLRRELPDRVFCRARILPNREDSGSGIPQTFAADFEILAADGQVLGQVGGFALKRATPTALLAASSGVRDLFHEPGVATDESLRTTRPPFGILCPESGSCRIGGAGGGPVLGPGECEQPGDCGVRARSPDAVAGLRAGGAGRTGVGASARNGRRAGGRCASTSRSWETTRVSWPACLPCCRKQGW